MANVAGTANSSGNNTIIAAQGGGLQIYVTGYSLSAASAVTYAWQDSAGISYNAPVNVPVVAAEADLSGDLAGSAPGYNQVDPSQLAELFVCSPNAALILNLSGAVVVTYSVDYYVR